MLLFLVYEQGIDSGEYSRTLMRSVHSVLGLVTEKEDAVPTPLELLTYAHGKAKVRSASITYDLRVPSQCSEWSNLFLLLCCFPIPFGSVLVVQRHVLCSSMVSIARFILTGE